MILYNNFIYNLLTVNTMIKRKYWKKKSSRGLF